MNLAVHCVSALWRLWSDPAYGNFYLGVLDDLRGSDQLHFAIFCKTVPENFISDVDDGDHGFSFFDLQSGLNYDPECFHSGTQCHLSGFYRFDPLGIKPQAMGEQSVCISACCGRHRSGQRDLCFGSDQGIAWNRH